MFVSSAPSQSRRVLVHNPAPARDARKADRLLGHPSSSRRASTVKSRAWSFGGDGRSSAAHSERETFLFSFQPESTAATDAGARPAAYPSFPSAQPVSQGAWAPNFPVGGAIRGPPPAAYTQTNQSLAGRSPHAYGGSANHFGATLEEPKEVCWDGSLLNTITLTGDLLSDPFYEVLPSSGKALATADLKVKRPRQLDGTDTGADWFGLEFWEADAETARAFLKKGATVRVEGRARIDVWREVHGAEKTKVTVVVERVERVGFPTGQWDRSGSRTPEEELARGVLGLLQDKLDDLTPADNIPSHAHVYRHEALPPERWHEIQQRRTPEEELASTVFATLQQAWHELTPADNIPSHAPHFHDHGQAHFPTGAWAAQQQQQQQQQPSTASRAAAGSKEALWELLFEDPTAWSDHRYRKASLFDADFIMKSGGASLWLNSHDTPDWVQPKLHALVFQ